MRARQHVQSPGSKSQLTNDRRLQQLRDELLAINEGAGEASDGQRRPLSTYCMILCTSLDHVSHHRTCLCIRALVLHACGQLLDRHRTAAKRLCDFEPMSCSRPKSLGLAPRLYLSLLLCRSYCHLAFNRSWIPAATSTS